VFTLTVHRIMHVVYEPWRYYVHTKTEIHPQSHAKKLSSKAARTLQSLSKSLADDCKVDFATPTSHEDLDKLAQLLQTRRGRSCIFKPLTKTAIMLWLTKRSLSKNQSEGYGVLLLVA